MAPPSFLRVKVTLLGSAGGTSVSKMMAVESAMPWGGANGFKQAAAAKVGVAAAAQLTFCWEGCEIEEGDATAVGSFMKDGDMLVLSASPFGAAAAAAAAAAAEAVLPSSVGLDLNPTQQHKRQQQEQQQQQGASLPPPQLSHEQQQRQQQQQQQTLQKPAPGAASLKRRHSVGAPPRPPSEAEKAPAAVEDVSAGAGACAAATTAEQPAGRAKRASTGADAAVPRTSRQGSRTSSGGGDSGASGSAALPHIPWHGQIRRGSSDGAHPNAERKCSCKHSKCVKLYCVCWAAGQQCNSCLCRDCFNTPENAEFLKAEQARTVARNPEAFLTKVETKRDGDAAHKVGCRCRKSHCIKKYCECFDGGVRCSAQCRCVECDNQPEEPEEPEECGLASLASAAQMAFGMLGVELLSPTMAAAVAPYRQFQRDEDAAAATAAAAPAAATERADAACVAAGTGSQRRSSTNTLGSTATHTDNPPAGVPYMPDPGSRNADDASKDAPRAACGAPPAEACTDVPTARPWSKGMPIPAGSSLLASLAARTSSGQGASADVPCSTGRPQSAFHVSQDGAATRQGPGAALDNTRPMEPLHHYYQQQQQQQQPCGLVAGGEKLLQEQQLAQLNQLNQLLMFQQQLAHEHDQKHAALMAMAVGGSTDAAALEQLQSYHRVLAATAASYGHGYPSAAAMQMQGLPLPDSVQRTHTSAAQMLSTGRHAKNTSPRAEHLRVSPAPSGSNSGALAAATAAAAAAVNAK